MHQTVVISGLAKVQWELNWILKWRYCTIFLAVFCGDIRIFSLFWFLKWPLKSGRVDEWFKNTTYGYRLFGW